MVDIIKLAQSILRQRGFYSGPIDGLTGPMTLKAVMVAIGEKYKLPEDRRRCEEYCVMFVQDYASTVGVDAGPVDGWYGPRTAAAAEIINSMIGEAKGHRLITSSDIMAAALEHDLDPALVHTVLSVESRGRGFLKSGKPVILFEGHKFWEQLVLLGLDPVKITPKLPEGILYPKWADTWYVGGEGEYQRLEVAMAVSQPAALRSASWGLFQLMGFNFELCGFKTVDDFVAAMRQGEPQQLDAFLHFIEATGLIKHLRAHKWAKFAHGYNGPAYKKNGYDSKLENAYWRYV